MSHSDPLLLNNKKFAESGGFNGPTIYPARDVCIITCLDPRTDPVDLFGLNLGDAAVIRNAGGRVNQAVIDDLALITFLSETKLRTGPIFEVMVVHHNQCGTHWLADELFRSTFVELTHLDEAALIEEAVVDPAATVRRDVEAILESSILSRKITVSGHTYDVTTGLVTTVVPATAMPSL